MIKPPIPVLLRTIGYVSGFLIYLILLLYGSQVMMGVMEEKTNRIAEVIVSSVRPFQLMLGKIIGIGMVALTQFFLWIAFVFIIYNVTVQLQEAIQPLISGWSASVQKAFYQYQCTVDTIHVLYFISSEDFSFIPLYMRLSAVLSTKTCVKHNH